MGSQTVIDDERREKLHAQVQELLRQAEAPSNYPRIRLGVQNLIAPAANIRDLAEEERVWFQWWYNHLGFNDVVVPRPPLSNNVIRKRRTRRHNPMAPVFRPPTHLVPFRAFLEALGWGEWWIITDDQHAQIQWEDAVDGYWFWVEVQDGTPRVSMHLDRLSSIFPGPKKSLLSLEEWVKAHFALRAKECRTIIDEYCLNRLRTRYGEQEILIASTTTDEGRRPRIQHTPRNFGESPDSLYSKLVGGRIRELIPAA